jgi:hypothetical protein
VTRLFSAKNRLIRLATKMRAQQAQQTQQTIKTAQRVNAKQAGEQRAPDWQQMPLHALLLFC